MISETNHRRDKHGTVRSALILRSDNLSRRVVRGAGFTLLGIASRSLITIASISILARLLTPADFGYVAMATIVTELAALFGNLGFAAVLVQRRIITRLQMDTVFWASISLGFCIALAVFLLSFAATDIFHEPMAGEILRIMCVTFIIDELVVVHGVLISRLMHFNKLFWIQLSSIFIRAITAIFFAWMGLGVWSLVIGSITGSVVKVVIYFLAVPYWPRLRFNLNYFRTTWKANSSYFASGTLSYINSSVDLFLVGRTLGATSLGYYQNARSLTDEIRNRMAAPLQRVLFPAFASLQTNHEWLQSSVQRSGRLIAWFAWPAGIGLAAIADDLVPVLYGEKWLAIIPALKLLGISAAIKASTTVATSLFSAKNKLGLALRYNAVGTLFLVASVLMAAPWGITAVSAAVALSSLYSLITYRAGLGIVGLGWKAMLAMLAPPVSSSAIMWLSIEATRKALTGQAANHSTNLLLYISLGVVVYSLALAILSRHTIGDMKLVLAKLRPNSTV